jgi:GH35 family endo-1,4-beta-xylanase
MYLEYLVGAILAACLATPASAQLDQLAKAAGLKYFGTAVDNPALGNQGYMRIARDTNEFGSITPANSQKWDTVQRSQGQFSYGSGDAIANVAKQTGQLLRCHTLVWYSQLPGWGAFKFMLSWPRSAQRVLTDVQLAVRLERTRCSASSRRTSRTWLATTRASAMPGTS